MSAGKLEPSSRSGPNPQGHSRARGRPFEKGNGGRRPGSRNRTTLVAEALLKGEEVELVRKAIELAKAGDTQMLKFLLDRILPKERSVQIELPAMERSSDAADLLAKIVNAVAAGHIAPNEGAAMTGLVAARARIMHDAELHLRLNDLEMRQKEIQHALEQLRKESRWTEIRDNEFASSKSSCLKLKTTCLSH